MKLQGLLHQAVKKLKGNKISSADLSAEILLSHILKKPRSYLYIWPDKTITKRQETRYKHMIQQRLKNEPVAYLINNKEFYGLNFYVDKNVLIPRPETEVLVDEIFKHIRIANHESRITICDIGTGSGCIAITLKKYLPKAKVYASDISKKALAVAKKNARKLKVKILNKQGDLLKPLKKIKINIIAANLPYLTPRQMKEESIQAEPKLALSGGKDGLDLYKELLNQVKEYAQKPLIFLEIDPRQAMKIRRLIKKKLPQAVIEIKKDLSGRNRIAIIR